MTFIPFRSRFYSKILEGTKVCTARTRTYGKTGDVLDTPVGKIRLVAVTQAPLKHIAERHWHEEGVSSPEEFMAVWNEIHPKGFNPDQTVYLHRFELVELK